MVEQEGFVRRPFYEVIVDLIRDDPLENDRGMLVIGRLLMEAKIPKGHDEIIAALEEKGGRMGNFWTAIARDVLAQKYEAEAEAREIAYDVLVQKHEAEAEARQKAFQEKCKLESEAVVAAVRANS